jgi:hypothetical protein
MFTRLRERSGSAGLVVAILALIVALGGTAYAAAKLNSVQKKEVVKIARKYAGKPGKDGAPGLAGSQGAKGDTGATGPAGKDGSNGTNGEPGEPGEDGVCSASTPECKMPSGATVTGVWGVRTTGVGQAYAPISYPLRFTGIPSIQVIGEGGPTTECPGSVANPQALAGNLCIYVATLENFNFCCVFDEDDGHSGVVLRLPLTNSAEEAVARGTWALTQ